MSTPRPRPAPVTNQIFLSLMLLHVLLLESCRSAGTDLRCTGIASSLCTPHNAGPRNQPAGAEVRSTSAPARSAVVGLVWGGGIWLRCVGVDPYRFDAVSSAGDGR